MKRNGKHSIPLRSLVAALLCAAIVITLCSGCGHRRNFDEAGNESSVQQPVPAEGTENTGGHQENGESETVAPDNAELQNLDATVEPSEIVDTYNVVLVVDTSSSIFESDPDRLALNAPVMFMESMYAGSANPERIKGAKHAKLNIITYNDDVYPCFNQLYSLDDAGTVQHLSKTLRETKVSRMPQTYDNALGDALLQAVEMLPTIKPQGGMMPPPPPPPGAQGAGMPLMPPPPPGPPPIFGGQEKNLIILFTDGYDTGGVSPTTFRTQGERNNTGNGNANTVQKVTSGSDVPQGGPQGGPPPFQEKEMPYLGGRTQEPLERALLAAQQRQCEIYVLGLNSAGGLDGSWEELKKIADYTQGGMMGPPPPPPGMPPQGGPMPGSMPGSMGGVPMPPPPPMMNIRPGTIGGGMFPNTDSTNLYVNYFLARNVVDAQHFYIQMAAAMLQGTGAVTPNAYFDNDYRDGSFNRYESTVQGSGISATVFYVLSDVHGDASVYMNLQDPDGRELSDELTDDGGGNGWDSSKTVRKNWYESCGVITVLNPKPGAWKLWAKTASGDRSKLSVYMVQIGGIDLEIQFKQGEKFADEGTIYVRAKYQNQYLSDDFYENVTARCEIMPQPEPPQPGDMPDFPGMMGEAGASQTDAQDSTPMAPPPPGNMPQINFPLEYDAASNAMVLKDYRASFPGRYAINAMLNDGEVEYTTSGTLNFEPKPSEELLIRRTGKSVSLVPQLTDSWKDIRLELVDNGWTEDPRGFISVARNKRDDNSLTVTGNEEGSGTLTVTVTATVPDFPGKLKWTIPYHVQVGR